MACMLPCGAQRPQGMATRATLVGRTRLASATALRILSYARAGSSSTCTTVRGRSARRRLARASVTLMDIATGPHRFDLPVLARLAAAMRGASSSRCRWSSNAGSPCLCHQ